jgi:hypothetical protein
LLETTKETTNDEVEKIKKITSLITDTGFANAFHKQANKLMNVRIFWGIVTIASTV